MNHHLPMLSLFLGIALATVGCPSKGPNPDPATGPTGPAGPTVTVSDGDNGKSVDLPNGGTLVVRLKSKNSTGFMWKVTNVAPLLKQLDKHSWEPPKDDNPESASKQVFGFRAAGPGAASVELAYTQDWDGGETGKTYKIAVTIK